MKSEKLKCKVTDRLRIGLIGCGTIGTRIARAIDDGEVSAVLTALHDQEADQIRLLVQTLNTQSPVVVSLEEVFQESDLIVEAASRTIAPQVLHLANRYHKDCMIMSVGGLLGSEDAIQEAWVSGIKIHCPSGALAGLDAVAAASIGHIDSVRLTTRKPPQALMGAPYITEKGIELDQFQDERVIFEGNALEAVPAFPKNINVAATLSLAGIGAEKTVVRIVADPKATRNSHQIEVEGEFGRLTTRTENLPSPFNPRTSYLAALSAVSCLKKITSPLKIGG